MIDSGVLIVIGLLSLWGLAVGVLWRRYTAAGSDSTDALASAVALLFGLLVVAGGGLHGIAVAPIPFLNDEPYDTRRVWLLTISLILVYAGLVNVVLHRRIRTGEGPALRTAAGATTLLFGFLLILHAASRRWILLPMSGSYLVLLLWCLRRSRASAAQSPGGPSAASDTRSKGSV